MVGRRKKHAFVAIKERCVKLLNNWSMRFLSAGGKEVFLKSILQAIPTYAMQCFKLPVSFCRELENLMCKFWWRNSKTNKGIHWCKWSEMCIPKAKGGLSFKDLSKFNFALLAKQGWKIITKSDCLFARVMKAKYFPKGDFMSAGVGFYPSYTWRSIWGARQLLEEGMGWQIGNGESVNIWNDSWLSRLGSGRIRCQNMGLRVTQVSDLINKENNTWKPDIIQSLFEEEQLKRILTIPLANSRPQDALVWRGDNTGTYTVKNGYRWLITEGGTRIHNELPANFFTKLWELQVPSKIRIFMWRITNNYLPTLYNLKARQLAVNPLCPVCRSEEESVDHLFRECPFTQQVLRGLEMPFSTCNRQANWKT
ncbi:hypothetical protein PVK06_001506 [Gossypium arboreum]|uniref:Reverse transcriptase zinc-binding domain-containing protein n=1 Tax=Gossypium arboreum TaxID=29729 RepID=A0ABR0R1C1_GOSAR|nr:hypothetical protein PVK06_001506 [Gossypium arboreum]